MDDTDRFFFALMLGLILMVLVFIGVKVNAWDDACIRRDYCEEVVP